MKITKLQLGLMIYFIIRAIYFFIYKDFSISITSMFLGTIIGLIIINMFYLFTKNIKLNNKNIFKIILLPLLIYLFIIIFKALTIFINYNYLVDYPLFIIGISILIIVIFLIKSNIHVLYKSVEIFGFVSFFLFITSLISLVNTTEVNNILVNIKINQNTLVNSFNYAFYTLLPLIIITNIDNRLSTKDIFKTTIISYSITNILIIVKFSLIIGILSPELINIYKYPFMNILKSISFYDFIDHMELLFGFEYLIDSFILLFSLSFYIKDILFAIKKIITK
ncbi:MAG: hypothetical protein ACI4OT_05765 [Bacilli bacterium]